jgi:hypothetical protein
MAGRLLFDASGLPVADGVDDGFDQRLGGQPGAGERLAERLDWSCGSWLPVSTVWR